MSFRLKDVILEDVQALIRTLTGFEENQENFKACERFILSNLLHHRYLSVDRHAVRRSIDGMIMKFQVHGLLERGQELDSLVNQFLVDINFKDYETADIEWCFLSLLLNLGQNPTNVVRNVEETCMSSLSFVTDDDREFDWVSYLKEGEEVFFDKWNEISSDEDEVDRMAEPQNKPATKESFFTTKDVSGVSLPVSQERGVSSPNECCSSKQVSAFNAQNVLSAENWLKNHIQHGWWSKAFVSHPPLSDHPFSKTAQLLDSTSKSGIKTSTLSEHKIVQEIIWLLAAPCNTAVFMQVISDDGLSSHYCVRPHVTAPSLIPDVFSSFLKSVCACADMIEELQTFSSELHTNSSDQKRVCSTYEAYSCALQSELKPLFGILSELEQQAHKQSVTLTLLILKEKLSPFLSAVASLHRLHSGAVLDWKKNPNWLCAIHLLSVVLSSMRNSEESNNISFRIFVKTFRVYIKIIDQWLTGAQLYDTRDEFFIMRVEKRNSALGASFEKRDWEKQIRALGVESPRALQVLANCLLKSAQPLHVLCELNRLSELRKYTASRRSLQYVFLQNLVDYLKSSQHISTTESGKKTAEEKDMWWKKLDHFLCEAKVSDPVSVPSAPLLAYNVPIDVKAVMSHLHRLQEPLLVKDFQSLFCPSQEVPACNSQSETNEGCLLKKVLVLSETVMEHVPLESCIEKAMLCLTADWDGIAGTLVADILVRERQLLHHMHTAQSAFLMQSYYKLQPFLSHIFKLILHRENLMWTNSHTLSILLQDCMDSDHFTITVTAENKDSAKMNALECIDCMGFKYQIDWPLCAIIGEKSQSAYNFIFCLLLKVRWGLWLLEDLDLADFKGKEKPEVSQRLLHLRYWLLHVIRGSYNFLAGHVLNGLWLKFEEDLKCLKDMHSIIEAHDKFLDNAVRQCLHASQPNSIKNAIFQLIVLAENLHALWNCGLSKVSLSKLSNMETCYSQCHRFLAASLHSLAEVEGLQHLVVLSYLFNWNIPKETLF